MINVTVTKLEDGYDSSCEIRGKGDIIFNELRALIRICLSDNTLTDMLVNALTIEQLEMEKHD